MAVGTMAKATAPQTLAIGVRANAIEFQSIAMGHGSLAAARNALASGTNSTALGPNSLAIGVSAKTTATANHGVAIGVQSVAAGERALAFGTGAAAFGASSFAFGAGALATGNYATAMGPNAIATGWGSTAIGMNAVANRHHEVTLGTRFSPYTMPGLFHKGFVGKRHQTGPTRFLTTDSNGAIGTTTFGNDDFTQSIGAVGALSAAMGSVPAATLQPNETVRCGLGTGTYGGQYAGSVGCAAKVAKRFYFNGGVAVTPTESVGGAAMGRLGFSIGFGGAPHKRKQAELALIPAMASGGQSLIQLGNGSHSTLPSTSNQPLAKTAEPLEIPTTSTEKSLRQELEELKREIQLLRQQAESTATKPTTESAYAIAMKRLEKMRKEKEELMAALTANTQRLQAQDQQIQEQRRMILEQQQRFNALLKKLDVGQ